MHTQARTVTSPGIIRSLLSTRAVIIGVALLLSGLVTEAASAQATQPLPHSKPASSAKNNGRPDLKCSYYDAKAQEHPGTCSADATRPSIYYCTADYNKKLNNIQSGCERKIKELRAWKLEQHQKQ